VASFGQREGNAMENALTVLTIAGAFLLLCLGILALSFARKISK
jgi:hypothetical protein